MVSCVHVYMLPQTIVLYLQQAVFFLQPTYIEIFT